MEKISRAFLRKQDIGIPDPDMDDNISRYENKKTGKTIVKLITGDCYITTKLQKESLTTILGSCISVCMRDPFAGLNGVAGMNHFLLPGSKDGSSHTESSTRFGAFAMESLINGLFKKGAVKKRLEIKVFGGGNVLKDSTAKIGDKNIDFVMDFLKNDGYKIIAKDVGGEHPRRIEYNPSNGEVSVRTLRREGDLAFVNSKESAYQIKIGAKPNKIEEDIELF